jgi:site-specific DNA-methyltransferase (adenine-specific)
MTPYYQDDLVTIYHGDAEEVMATFPAASVSVVFTSPPYNRGDMSGGLANLAGGYRAHHDQMPHDEYVAWQRRVLSECWRLITDDGAIFYNHSPRIQNGELWLPTELNPGLPLRQVVIWDQVVGINWSPSFFLPLHEWVMVFAKSDWRLASRSASNAGDVWRIRVEVPKSGRPKHPAAFPLRLPQTALSALTPGVVLDPFMGSGTTLEAAKSLGRKSIGIELDESYCEMAANRVRQETLGLSA